MSIKACQCPSSYWYDMSFAGVSILMKYIFGQNLNQFINQIKYIKSYKTEIIRRKKYLNAPPSNRRSTHHRLDRFRIDKIYR